MTSLREAYGSVYSDVKVPAAANADIGVFDQNYEDVGIPSVSCTGRSDETVNNCDAPPAPILECENFHAAGFDGEQADFEEACGNLCIAENYRKCKYNGRVCTQDDGAVCCGAGVQPKCPASAATGPGAHPKCEGCP